MSKLRNDQFLEPEWWVENYWKVYSPTEIANLYKVNIRKVICRAYYLTKKGYPLLLRPITKYYCKSCSKEISFNGYKYGSNLCRSCSSKEKSKQYIKPHFKINEWTNDEIEILKNNFEHKTSKEIAKLMNRSPIAIYKKGVKLGLKKDYNSYLDNLQKILDYRNKNENNSPERIKKAQETRNKQYLENPELLPQFKLRRNYMTKIEREMELILKDLGLKCHWNKYVKTKNTWRFPDFQIEGKNIVIECDGEYWHSKRVNEDKKREQELNEIGLEVIRFSDKAILKDKEKVIECIRQKLNL